MPWWIWRMNCSQVCLDGGDGAGMRAAIAPICGDGNSVQAHVLATRQMPIWMFHGDAILWISHNGPMIWRARLQGPGIARFNSPCMKIVAMIVRHASMLATICMTGFSNIHQLQWPHRRLMRRMLGVRGHSEELYTGMKTQYFTATSLDGFIDTEHDSLDWLFPLGDLNTSSYPAFIAEVGALAMGSATYEWMVHNPEKVAAETGIAWPYTQPAWIFSRRQLPIIEGADIQFVRGDVHPVHTAMRAAAGTKNIWVVGGGDLAGQFYDAGVLDELIIQVGSATLGKGKPLFPRRVLSPVLRLVSVQQLGAGMVELRYAIDKGV
jgi:dihydrofolate reductase